MRSIPLRPQGDHIGALVLVRDVTDLRRRDRELVTKDATIREIHHRVKNNLQTVAALLRLQARRMDNESARLALEEAVRRVGSIAIVHEILSQAVEEQVDFDDIIDPLGRMVTDVSAVGSRVRVRRAGTFGVLPSESATALAMVLTELLQNAVEHGYDPDVGRADRDRSCSPRSASSAACTSRSTTTVAACPDGFDLDASTSLGLSIVRTLVESELGGQLELGPRPDGRGHPSSARRTRRVTWCDGQAVRTRARALRRLSARRSSSLRPPHTPWSCPASSAHARHCSRTSQRRHTCLASSIWRMAGPVLPIGKNSSGSSSRHAERWRQSMARGPSLSR